MRFHCSAKFHQKVICVSRGSSKKESKAAAAKLALFKTAPNVYRTLFSEEVPPEDYIAAKEIPETFIPDNEVTLGTPRLVEENGKGSKLFEKYQIWLLFQIATKQKGLKYTEQERTNPH
jgi:hypothetical protein